MMLQHQYHLDIANRNKENAPCKPFLGQFFFEIQLFCIYALCFFLSCIFYLALPFFFFFLMFVHSDIVVKKHNHREEGKLH